MQISTILEQIGQIESRLGTPMEQPADLDRVTELVHRLSNGVTELQLSRAIARGELEPVLGCG